MPLMSFRIAGFWPMLRRQRQPVWRHGSVRTMVKATGTCLVLLSVLGSGFQDRFLPAGGTILQLPEWHGEYFQKRHGGLYLRLAAKGFPASPQTQYLTGSVLITITNLLSKKDYSLTFNLVDVAGQPSQIWQAESGKYKIKQIVIVDTLGVKRTWWGANVKTRAEFSVKRQCLANLGIWTIMPQAKAGLSASFTSAPNVYRETGSRQESSIAAVVDGYTGLIQQILAGKSRLLGEQKDQGSNAELRQTITSTRQISMFYQLNLFRHNEHAAQIANVLAVSEGILRQCFIDRLDDGEHLGGDVVFTFLLSKQSGTMIKLKHTGGSLTDPKVIECMYLELAQIQFPVADNMLGELTYDFGVK